MGMQCKVAEIAPDTYRLSTFHSDYGIQFNQFLIKDDEPFLMHTGFKRMFPNTLEGVAYTPYTDRTPRGRQRESRERSKAPSASGLA